MLDYLISFLILTGAIFIFIGSLGLVRLRDFYTRLHGQTKATTLGVGCLLIASSLYFSIYTAGLSLHEILITIFLFITAPVSAHMLAKAALHVELRSLVEIPEEKLTEKKKNDAAVELADKQEADKPPSTESIKTKDA